MSGPERAQEIEMTVESFEMSGKTIVLEHGEVAHRANGAVVVRCGDAMLLATVTVAAGGPARDEEQDGDSFVPLTVEYRERMAAAARIPGGFGKRELRLSDHEVLVSRLVDRAIRPLFPEGFASETQVLVTVYSAEQDSDLEVLAVLAASAALTVSDVPWRGPVAAARVKDGVDLIGAAHADGLVMLEGGGDQVSEAALAEALGYIAEAARPALEAMSRLAQGTPAKAASEERPRSGLARSGRGASEVRPIAAKVGYLPSNDGSALFSRGQTQALVSVTLGQQDEAPVIENVFGKRVERFFLHYNFPSFSVGEVKPSRGPGRREIGHGALARRALVPVLPDEMPYSVRVVSDILTSDGSSSMATVCGTSLALMDAGVPVKAAVAGVALGLSRAGGESELFVDITGEEDAGGDMDFKVAGTRAGLTAVQLDIKGGPVAVATLAEALQLARPALDGILAEMDAVLAEPRADMKRGTPHVVTLKVPERRIGALIGPGGKTINEVQTATSTRIDVKDDGRVKIVGKRLADVKAAEQRVLALTIELKIGETYDTEVVTLKEYGVFVRVGDHEGLVHVSELDEKRVERVEDVAQIGDTMRVKVIGADEKGRLKLSRRAAM